MKIIGAGLPRTATLTLKIALEMLGAAPCYHMANILTDLSLVSRWIDALNGQADGTRSSMDSKPPSRVNPLPARAPSHPD